MSTARRGLTIHEMLHSAEGYRKSLTEKGNSEHESLRCALALTFALSGKYTREQAWEAANEIAAQRKQQGGVTWISEISLPDSAEYTESGTVAPLSPSLDAQRKGERP